MDGVNELAGDGGPPHDPGMEARVAVLEEIAASTKQAVADFRQRSAGFAYARRVARG